MIPAYPQEKDKKPAKADTKTSAEKESKEKETKKEAKDKDEKSDDIDSKVYSEIILEDFEETQFAKKNIIVHSKTQEGDISIRDQFPAPGGKSKKYLGVKMFGRDQDTMVIYPAKELQVSKFCREISMWVYGKKFAGELSIMVQDASGKNHRLILGKLDFLGWRKLKVQLLSNVSQEDELLNKKKFLKILHFQYKPGNKTPQPIWHYFYIDDIGAQVREKYTDHMSDEW